MGKDKKTIAEVVKEKSERLMEGVAVWCGFYRANPQRFAKDFLNITLKTFQKINLYEMMHNTNTMYIASRGQGKSWLLALFCVIRCILFPGTKIVVASGVKAQALEIIQKINDDFLKNYSWGSSNLRNEISGISVSINNAYCDFKNGSYIHIVTANDNARHNRANIIIIDEFRMVDLRTINTVLKKFLTTPRNPGYLNNPKYKHLIERNCELYASSAWYKSHWSYEKAQSYFASMLDDKRKYFVCGLPYQIAIKENLLSREQVIDEMSENDFDDISWRIEMGCEFYSDGENAFFRYEDLSKCRKIKTPFVALSLYSKRGLNVPDLAPNERRILSIDVALMASRRHNNDATAIWINCAIPNNENIYVSNYVYIETFEGLTADELGLIIMRYFYHYKCTDVVLDTRSVGIPVFDAIAKDRYDPDTGETYGALTAIDNDDMAARCKVKSAKKVVYCIEATAKFNSLIATSFRAAIKNGLVNLPATEFDAEETIKKTPGYAHMTDKEKAQLQLPFIQTGMLINEAINLEYETNNNLVSLKEKSGMRKDRVSSIMYNNYVTQILSNKLKPRNKTDVKTLVDRLPFKVHHSRSVFD